MNPTYIDAHSHLADPRFDSPGDEFRRRLLAEAKALGLGLHVQGGVGPEDWALQKRLAEQYPEILPVYGLHPYWVSDHNEAECTSALDTLARSLGGAVALGETGLDFRPHIVKESKDLQLSCFEAQLELAEFAHLPVVLHLVRAFDEALRVFDLWGVPPRGGMVHSFNATVKEAEAYLKLGFYISVGGPAARASNHRLHQALKEIPLERLLLETDSPDQPPDPSVNGASLGFNDELNRPATIFQVAEAVAKIHRLSPSEVLDIASQNCRKLLSL